MSIKRQATTELNHDNWDQEDPSEHEEMGSFKSATKDILEKRVIRTAKRRSLVPGSEAKKGVFSGFGGFNKIQPSSFDFLANLTNGGTNTNGTPNKTDASVTSSLFSSKPSISSPSSNVFGTQETTAPKLNFGIPATQASPVFGGSLTTNTALSGFTASKADSTVGDSPFKIQPVSSSADTKTTTANLNAPTSQVTSTIFGIPSTSANTNKSLFSTNTNSTPFKIQPVSSTTTTVPTGFGIVTKAASNTNSSEKKVEDKSNDKKIKYYTKLRGLNESVSDWIKMHVGETPLCILSPIFKDYEKYLKEIQAEYHSPEKEESNKNSDTKSIPSNNLENVTSSKNTSVFPSNNAKTEQNTNAEPPKAKTSILGPQITPAQITPAKPSFSFGINSSTSSATNTTTPSTGFTFGITTSTQSTTAPTTATTSTSFAFGTNTNTSTNGVAPFSFGIGKPFTFNSNVQSNTENNTEKEEDEEPPKVEFTPVVEENTVFEKRCKIFVKKDGNFADKGVGTLYIKKIVESGKHQLLVRANTSLGNILLNLILASAIPTQRMGKNNVMMVCIPTPDSKPPPTPVLIRVKTSEEADELLNTLDKYKT